MLDTTMYKKQFPQTPCSEIRKEISAQTLIKPTFIFTDLHFYNFCISNATCEEYTISEYNLTCSFS